MTVATMYWLVSSRQIANCAKFFPGVNDMTRASGRSRAAWLAMRVIVAAAVVTAIAMPSLRAEEPTVDELQKRIDERDAVIRDLVRRVEALERQTQPAAALPPAARPPGTSPAAAVAPVPVRPGTFPPAVQPAQQEQQPQSQPQQQQQQPPAPAPGQIEVSEEAAQRALERALVQTGALLLPSGVGEFVPGFRYIRRETDNPGQIAVLSNGQIFATNNLIRSNQLEASALFRLGLPYASQVEVTVPYDYKSLTTANQVGGTALSAQTADAWGFGDPSFTFIKQLTTEGAWRPGLFGAVGWDTNWGQRRHGIAAGTGFDEITGSLTAVKRQDPLVFTAGLGYAHSLQYAGIQPGDVYTTSLQMFFGISPETTLRISPQLAFADETRLRGAPLPGSNQVAGTMTFGALSILGPGLVMDLNTDIGLTRDAPKYAVRVSFPIRFGLY